MNLDDVKPVNSGDTSSDDVADVTLGGDTPAPNTEQRKAAKETEDKTEAKPEDAKEADEEKASEDTSEASDADKSEDKAASDEVWPETADETSASVIDTLKDAGVTPTDAKALLWDAVQAGDPTKIDRDALVEKVGAARANLIMIGVKDITTRNNAQIEAARTVVNEAAGSAENWARVRDWAQKNVPEADLAEYREMIDRGGRFAKVAAQEIVEKYNADSKNTSVAPTSKAVTPDSKPSKPSVQGISRSEYGRKLDILVRRGAKEAEFNALKAQRRAGVQQGL